MTIIDERVDKDVGEPLYQLIKQLTADQRAEVQALVTGMVMQAQITARKAG